MNMTRDQLRLINPAAAQALDEDDARRAQRGLAKVVVNPLPAYVTAPTESARIIQGEGASALTTASPRVRQSRRSKMNKTETDFFLRLQNLTAGKIRFNAVRFELANGLHFKPDFTVDMRQAYEAKGPWASRDAFPRLKMAARLFPEIKWFLATRSKGGGWDIQDILP